LCGQALQPLQATSASCRACTTLALKGLKNPKFHNTGLVISYFTNYVFYFILHIIYISYFYTSLDLDLPNIRDHHVVNNTLRLYSNQSSELYCDSESHPPGITYSITEDGKQLSTVENRFFAKTGGGAYSCTVKNQFITKKLTFKVVAGELQGKSKCRYQLCNERVSIPFLIALDQGGSGVHLLSALSNLPRKSDYSKFATHTLS